MRRYVAQPGYFRPAPAGTMPLALGLALVTAAMVWPAVPIVTAVALVTLGATSATSAKLRPSPWAAHAMLCHAIVYAGLYLTLVGARLDAEPPLHPVLLAGDVAASVPLMAIAVAASCRAMARFAAS